MCGMRGGGSAPSPPPPAACPGRQEEVEAAAGGGPMPGEQDAGLLGPLGGAPPGGMLAMLLRVQARLLGNPRSTRCLDV